MNVWIVFNEYREVMGVIENKKAAEKMRDSYNEMAEDNLFSIEEHEIEKSL